MWIWNIIISNNWIAFPLRDVEGFPSGASGKESTCQCRKPRRCEFDPWVRKNTWNRKGQPTPVFLPENPVDRGAWQAVVHGVTKSQTQLKRLSTSIIRLIKVHSSHRFSLYCTFYGFDKCMMSCIHPYNILQNSFIALNIPCAPSVHLSPALGNCWFFFFYCLHSLLFQS